MKQIRSEEARRTFRDLLDEVERDPDTAIGILRYDRPVAVLVSADWFESTVTSHEDWRARMLALRAAARPARPEPRNAQGEGT